MIKLSTPWAIALFTLAGVATATTGFAQKVGNAARKHSISHGLANTATSPFAATPQTGIVKSRQATQAVLLSSDFNNGLAPWTTVSLDNQQSNSALSTRYRTGGFISSIDLRAVGKDSVASSTSWFTAPTGGGTPVQANRWLISPALTVPAGKTVRLTWSAWARDAEYRDGYRVLFSTTGNQPANFTNVLFSVPTTGFADGTATPPVPGEEANWITRTVTLPATATGQIYVAFHQNSKDMFILDIDDVVISTIEPYQAELDVAGVNPTLESFLPRSFVPASSLYAAVTNKGTSDLNSVIVNFTKVSGPGAAYTAADTISLVQVDSTREASVNGLPFTATGLYRIRTSVATAASQPNNAIVSFDTLSLNVSDSVLARDNGVYNTGIGQDDDRAEIAQLFIVPVTDTLTSITIRAGSITLSNPGPTIGDTISAAVYAVNPTTGAIATTPIATSPRRFITSSLARNYTLPIVNGTNQYVVLQPGVYAFAGRQESINNAFINASQENYVPGTVYLRAGANPAWFPQEAAGFFNTYALRPNFGRPRTITSIKTLAQQFPFSIYPNPTAGVANLSLTLAREAAATIQIMDVTGRTVSTVALGKLAAGAQTHQLSLQGLNQGTYVVRVTVDGIGASTSRLVVK